jgi:hypothetical protein
MIIMILIICLINDLAEIVYTLLLSDSSPIATKVHLRQSVPSFVHVCDTITNSHPYHSTNINTLQHTYTTF